MVIKTILSLLICGYPLLLFCTLMMAEERTAMLRHATTKICGELKAQGVMLEITWLMKSHTGNMFRWALLWLSSNYVRWRYETLAGLVFGEIFIPILQYQVFPRLVFATAWLTQKWYMFIRATGNDWLLPAGRWIVMHYWALDEIFLPAIMSGLSVWWTLRALDIWSKTYQYIPKSKRW